MPYTNLDELRKRFGDKRLAQITDHSVPATGEIDTAVVARAIADTDAVIDGYLKGRYSLPLSATPPLLVDLAITICIYKLHPAAPEEKIRKDYEDALRSLREIAAGTIRLDVEGAEPASSGASGVKTTDRARDLTPENLKGFI